jgi:2-polyprenyl-6-methoxyphenol hydroxylase-like FAD-dependent oxidoreductase
MRILIVGAGIAGPDACLLVAPRWSRADAGRVRVPASRGGYLVDFWGAGFEVAERMGIVPELRHRGYVLAEARAVDRDGHRVASFKPSAIMGPTERYVSVARSDLAAVIYGALDGGAELILNDTVQALVDDGNRVRVTFESGQARDFDLVVGADGLHSRVRRLSFGPDEQFEKYLNIVVVAFDIEKYRPRNELIAMMHAEVGFQAVRLSLRDDVTMMILRVRYDGSVPTDSVPQQQALLRERMVGAGWEIPTILDAMPEARTFYFDSVSQIRMPFWTRGRVALIGDAAACPSLLAGQGSALAMVESYVLAAELSRSLDHRQAFARYQERLAPLLRSKQDAAVSLGAAFAPTSKFQLLLRNTIMRLMGLPKVADLAMGRSFRDAVELPAFSAA